MFSRKYYEAEFVAYPDLVLLSEMRKMLGGITERKALDLLHNKQIKAFYVEQRYMIPKICIIDYLISRNKNSINDKLSRKKPAQRRKSGTGCIRQINENLWEGKFAPINAHGQRIARYVYAKTHDECEIKLMKLIEIIKQDFSAEKAILDHQSSKST